MIWALVSVPNTTIKVNPSLSNTFTSGKGYLLSVSASKSVSPSVDNEGWITSEDATAGTITVQNADTPAYVAQNSFGTGTAPSGITPSVLNKNTVYKLSAGYYHADRYYKTPGDTSLSGDSAVGDVVAGKTFYSNSY